MQVIGFNFNKILAEKTGKPEGKLNIAMNINFSDLEKEETKALNKDVLRTDFEFNIIYQKVAKFEIKGSVYFIATPEKLKEMLKKWQKEKKLSDEARVPLMNFVLTKCNVKTLQLEEEFSLPSHIPLPKVTQTPPGEKAEKSKDAKYV
jgi:hypothetical protein